MNAALTDTFISIRQSIIWSVMRIVGDRQAAEDVAQETYVRASRAMENGTINHLEAFLHQTAHNLAINYKRRQLTRGLIEIDDIAEGDIESIPSQQPSQEATLLQKERVRVLMAALDKLPPRVRTAWILSRYENWTSDQIAKYLGVSRPTILNDIKRAHAHCIDIFAKFDRS